MKNSKEKSSVKRWQSMFYIGKWLRQITSDHPFHGPEGSWVESITVLSLEHGSPVTKRFYSREVDAQRGAAQIYNRIEKSLLGG
jgi:hypothetical protein